MRISGINVHDYLSVEFNYVHYSYLSLEFWEDMSIEDFLKHLMMIMIMGYFLGGLSLLHSNHRSLVDYQSKADHVRSYLNSLELPGIPRIEQLEISVFESGIRVLRRVMKVYEDLHAGLIAPNTIDRLLLDRLPGKCLLRVDQDLKGYFLGSMITGNHTLLLSDDIGRVSRHLAGMKVEFDFMNDDPKQGIEMDKLIRLLYMDILSRVIIEHTRSIVFKSGSSEREARELAWPTGYDLFINGPFEILDELDRDLRFLNLATLLNKMNPIESVPVSVDIRTDSTFLDTDPCDHAVYPMMDYLTRDLNNDNTL